jgi:hypothetical protein
MISRSIVKDRLVLLQRGRDNVILWLSTLHESARRRMLRANGILLLDRQLMHSPVAACFLIEGGFARAFHLLLEHSAGESSSMCTSPATRALKLHPQSTA